METLHTPFGKFTAYINLLEGSDQITYHISFVDNHNKLRTILMSVDENEWFIQTPEKHPEWLLALKPTLETLVMKNIVSEKAN